MRCLILSLGVVLTVAGCGDGDSAGGRGITVDSRNSGEGKPSVDTIRIVPWGPRYIDFIDFYVGEEKGYFADANLRVEQLSAEGAGDAVRYVLAGNADIAMADPFAAYFAIQRGVDLKGFYCPYTQNWMTLVVNTKNSINKPADLEGKTIAVTSQASTSRFYAMFFLAANGLNEDDVRMASVGRDFASALLGGSVDAASTWDSINWAMFRNVGDPEEQGFGIWRYEEQVSGPNDVYFAQGEWLQNNKEVVQRFIDAIAKAKRWIEENPEKAAVIGSRHALGADDPVRNRAIIDMRIEMQNNGPGVEEHGMGWCDIQTMSDVATQAVELGILEKHIDMAGVITNEFTQSP